jgi:hypothetical protein
MEIFLHPPYIKHGLIKFLAKAMVMINSKEFQYPSKKFPKITTAKLKEGIFVGPEIRGSLEDEAFVESLTDTERAARERFKWICSSFLGRKKSPDFSDGIQKLLNAYKERGSCMSLKVQFFALTFGFISRKPW